MRRVVFFLVAMTLEMMVVAYAGWRWSLPVVIVVAAVVAFALPAGWKPADRPPGWRRSEAILAIAAVALVTWIVLGGAATSFDLLLFWGAKGQQFGRMHTIDVAFLADPAHHIMQPDYPPLVPLLYAGTMLGGDRLNWFAAILTAPLFLALATCAVYEFRPRLTAVFATMFGFLFVLNSTGGNAEPALIFFAAVALVSDDDLLTTVALTGAVLTKLEGAVFAALFIAAIALHRRKPMLLLRLGALPAAALGSWIAFVRFHHLASVYAGTVYGPFSPAHLGGVARVLLYEASFDVAYVPWIVAGLFLATRRARLPALAIAAGMLAFLLFVYARASDMTPLVLFSAKRVLMTPLLALLLSHPESSAADGAR